MKRKYFNDATDIPLAVKMLDHIERENFNPENGFNVLNGLAWLVAEQGYKVNFYPKDSAMRAYSYPILVGTSEDRGGRESYKETYFFHLLESFKEHLANQDKMILLNPQDEKVKSLFAHSSEPS